MIFRVVVAVFALVLMGYGVLRALLGSHSSSGISRPILLSLAFGTGAGLQGLGLFYLSYCAVPLNTRNSLLLLCGLFVSGWGSTILLRSRNQREVATGQQSAVLGDRRSDEQWNRLQICLLIFIACAAFLVFVDACGQPLLSFDSRATWAYKAKVLYYEAGIYGDAFFDPDRLHAKTRYPQLIPFEEAFLALCAGRFEERALKIVFPLYFLSLILLLFFTLRTRLPRTNAFWAVALFSTLPGLLIFVNGGAASGYADVPLAFNFTALVLLLLQWLRTQSQSILPAAALFGVLTAFTKMEGSALLLISLGVTGVAAFLIFLRRFRTIVMLVSLLVGMGLLLLPWFHFQSLLPVLGEDFYHLLTVPKVISGLGRLPAILLAFGKELFLKPHFWSFLGFFLLLALVNRRKNVYASSDLILIVIPLLYAVLLAAVFLVTPWQLEVLLPLTASRLMMHTVALMFLWVTWQLNPSRLKGCSSER